MTGKNFGPRLSPLKNSPSRGPHGRRPDDRRQSRDAAAGIEREGVKKSVQLAISI
jgi:hypothetical protein